MAVEKERRILFQPGFTNPKPDIPSETWPSFIDVFGWDSSPSFGDIKRYDDKQVTEYLPKSPNGIVYVCSGFDSLRIGRPNAITRSTLADNLQSRYVGIPVLESQDPASIQVLAGHMLSEGTAGFDLRDPKISKEFDEKFPHEFWSKYGVGFSPDAIVTLY